MYIVIPMSIQCLGVLIKVVLSTNEAAMCTMYGHSLFIIALEHPPS